ncbi:MAG: MarR family winged helix-turn-helix transcriptional regulator [Rubripirellula sp.]
MADKCEAAAKTRRRTKPKAASPQQQLVAGLLRTSDAFQYRFAQLYRDFGLTEPQYSVLRILRDADRPLPCLEIASRLITRVPAITSLIDKLEKQSWVERHRCDQDRRIWYVSLTSRGRRLLTDMDRPVDKLHRELCEGLSKRDCQQLTELLEKARQTLQE